MSDQNPDPLKILGNASDRAERAEGAEGIDGIDGIDGIEGIEGIDGLRERAAIGLEAALAFVEQHGNELARLRARILVGLEPLDRGLELLASYQRPGGSFPSIGQVLIGPASSRLGRGDASLETVGTLEAISVLSDWEHLHEPCGDRAIAYLSQAQAEDGSWGAGSTTEGDDAITDPAVSIFVTGCTAGFLGRSRTARPEVLQAAGAYLGRFWSVDFIRKQGWLAVAGFAHYFTNVFDEEGEAALPWCARELDRGKRVGEYSAIEVLRVLFYCQASALPGVDFDTNGLLDEFLKQQSEQKSNQQSNQEQADGGVGPPELAQASEVASSLDAMLFMLRICRSAGQ